MNDTPGPLRSRDDAERLFEATFEQAAVGIAHVAPDGSWLRVNRKVCEIVGYSREALLGLTFQAITHPDDLKTDVRQVQRLLDDAIDSYQVEKRYVRGDGAVIWVNLTVSLVRCADGTPDFFVAVLEDIQQQKDMALSLQESDARMRRLIDNIPGIIYQFSSRMGGTQLSPRVEQVFGLPRSYLLENPQHWQSSIHPDDLPAVLRAVESLRGGTPFEIEYRVRDAAGRWHWLLDRSISCAVTDDDIVIEGFALDITERKEREEALRAMTTQLERIARSLPGAIFEVVRRPDGSESIPYMSAGSQAVWGIPAEDVMADIALLWATVVPEDKAALAASVDASARDQAFWHYEWRVRTRAGELKWLGGSGTTRRLPDGGVAWTCVVTDVTSERLSRQALDSFFDQHISMNLIVDRSGTILKVNDAWTLHLGYPRSELVGRRYIDFVHPEDRHVAEVEQAVIVDSGESSLHFENRWRHRNGGYRRLSWSSRAAGDEGVIYAVAADITELHEAEQQLKQAAAVFASTAEGVVITTLDGTIKDVNRAFTAITGYSREAMIGENPRMLQSGRHEAAFYASLWETLLRTGGWRGEIWNRTRDGRIYPSQLTISTTHDDRGEATGYVGVFSDITNIKEHEAKLDHLAHYDSLTGLANRALFLELLDQAIRDAERRGTLLAVLFFDLDQFKGVNDSLGHHTGDALLRSAAQRLKRTVRDNDIVARMSGDEFVLLLQNLESEAVLQLMIERIVGVFAEPFEIDANRLRVSASVGISVYPRDARDASSLLQFADSAMYEAKDEGRNTVRFFTPELDAQAVENAELGRELAMALERGELSLHYQPQVELMTGKVVGLEALLRWTHPRRGAVAPDRFIPIAEMRGMMMEIGTFVLESACRQAVAWLAAGVDFGRVAVNVSGNQLQNDGFLAVVDRTLANSGLPARHLELELTESVLMRRTDRARAALASLSERGIQLAVDDFGTGYSSLSYLSKLPVDRLKIDRQFIRDVLLDGRDAALAASIVAMGRALRLDVVAEGVETEAQATFLRDCGCRLAQGYLYGRPAPAGDVPGQIAGNRGGDGGAV